VFRARGGMSTTSAAGQLSTEVRGMIQPRQQPALDGFRPEGYECDAFDDRIEHSTDGVLLDNDALAQGIGSDSRRFVPVPTVRFGVSSSTAVIVARFVPALASRGTPIAIRKEAAALAILAL
jgi:hypothetical protein